MESKKDCAKLFSCLDYDKETMGSQSAVLLYGEFGAWHDGNFIRYDSKITVSKTSVKNTVWHMKTNLEKEAILKDIALKFQKYTKDISDIELTKRGIKEATTKEDVNKIVQYFNCYAKWVHLLKNFNGENWERRDMVRLYLDDSSPLLYFGLTIAAAFTAGNRVEIIAGDNITCTLMYITTLLNQFTSYPCESLSIISERLCEATFFTPPNDKKVKIGSVMTVYENCDQDSAADMVIYAACSRREYLPWSLKRLLVQESVYSTFLVKVSERLAKVKPRSPTDADTGIAELNNLLAARHIDTSKPMILLNDISPHLIKQLATGEFFTSIISVQSFRTTKEAVSLINSVPTSALSVWCENQSVSNEISLLANVTCVWQNLFGHICPTVPMEVKFDTENRFIGGKRGILDEMVVTKLKSENTTGIQNTNHYLVKSNVFSTCVSMARKMQGPWGSTDNDARSDIFIKVAGVLDKKRDHYVSVQKEMGYSEPEKIFDDVIAHLYYAAEICAKRKNECVINVKKMCLSLLRPLGVIYIGALYDSLNLVKLATSVVMFGNSVIYNVRTPILFELCQDMRDNGFPIIQSVNNPYEHDISNIIKCDQVNGIWVIDNNAGSIVTPNTVDENNTTVLQNGIDTALRLSRDSDFMEMRFSTRKNIWSTFGETFSN